MSTIAKIHSRGVLNAVVDASIPKPKEELKEKTIETNDRYESSKKIENGSYDSNGKKKDLKDLEGAEFHTGVALKRAEIRADILSKTKALLFKTFNENPEFAEDIKNGIVPDYFNEKNTASRMLDIYLPHFAEGDDRESFVKHAKSLISQAYGEVTEINNGGLPDLVNRTRELVFEKLDAFLNGQSIEDIYSSLKEPVEESDK
jgi:hypothetical protein